MIICCDFNLMTKNLKFIMNILLICQKILIYNSYAFMLFINKEPFKFWPYVIDGFEITINIYYFSTITDSCHRWLTESPTCLRSMA